MSEERTYELVQSPRSEGLNYMYASQMHVKVASEYVQVVLEYMRDAGAGDDSEGLSVMERVFGNLEEARVGLERAHNFLEKVGIGTGKTGNGRTG